MADIGWGNLTNNEGYGRLGDTKDDYKILTYDDAKGNYSTYMHGAHAMFYSTHDFTLWDLYNTRAAILMQMRFDGLLGFPGGLIDQGEEDVVSGLNRELEEEIGLDLTRFCIKDENHLVSFLHEKKNLVLHFYAKEVSMIEFREIELKSLSAPDFGSEVMGVIRPPLFTMGDGKRGLPAFLTNSFAGNAREELVYAIRHLKLLTDTDLQESLKEFEELMKSKNSSE
ncbi:hypothetical protein ACJMK2_016064 [Sinanodonta woodiana]|uniref:U8 snoRNA-decapping enzyme n=1 Tax=Sinanodonta woodiana TaxID=1069815 RepID=A0ABD3USE3_SINWO